MNNYTEYLYENRFKGYKFEFEGRPAEVAFPEKMTDNMAWTLKTEYSYAFPAVELKLLENGVGRAFIKNAHRWGGAEDLALKARFADFLHSEFGFSKKCIPVGYSCGGIFAVKFASYYPEYVSCIHIDAPVINFLSCPVHLGHDNFNSNPEEIMNALGLTLAQLGAYRDAPIDHLGNLIKNRIPCSLVYGDADPVVLWEENAALVIEAYKDSGVPFRSESVPGRVHHPHEPIDFDGTVGFILANCK